jgi:hypothetical protein
MIQDTRNKICALCSSSYTLRNTAFPFMLCISCEQEAKDKIAKRDAAMKNPMKKDN